MRKLITITAILWGMVFALPFLYGEATFMKRSIPEYEAKRLLTNEVICGHKFEIPATFDECNGFKSIKVPRPSKHVTYYTTDRSYKVKPFVFNCYDFSERSAVLSITDKNGKQLLMVGNKIIKDER